MTVKDIIPILNCTVYTKDTDMDIEIHTACGSDMMSDVLAFVKEQSILLTGLLNPQAIRTAEMMDMHCIVFVRGKAPDENMINLAQDKGITLMSTEMRMFSACGKLWESGLRG